MIRTQQTHRVIAVAQKLLTIHTVSAAYGMQDGSTNIRVITTNEFTRFKNLNSSNLTHN